jgi:hypothetical protein
MVRAPLVMHEDIGELSVPTAPPVKASTAGAGYEFTLPLMYPQQTSPSPVVSAQIASPETSEAKSTAPSNGAPPDACRTGDGPTSAFKVLPPVVHSVVPEVTTPAAPQWLSPQQTTLVSCRIAQCV